MNSFNLKMQDILLSWHVLSGPLNYKKLCKWWRDCKIIIKFSLLFTFCFFLNHSKVNFYCALTFFPDRDVGGIGEFMQGYKKHYKELK